MFISYITDNVRILRLILDAAVENAKEWNEFDFKDNLPKFLKEQRPHFVSIPAPNAQYFGIKIKFNVKFIMAPIITEIRV